MWHMHQTTIQDQLKIQLSRVSSSSKSEGNPTVGYTADVFCCTRSSSSASPTSPGRRPAQTFGSQDIHDILALRQAPDATLPNLEKHCKYRANRPRQSRASPPTSSTSSPTSPASQHSCVSNIRAFQHPWLPLRPLHRPNPPKKLPHESWFWDIAGMFAIKRAGFARKRGRRHCSENTANNVFSSFFHGFLWG